MAYDAKTQRLISLKKLAGKAQTSNDKDLANEGLPSGLTLSAETASTDLNLISLSTCSLYSSSLCLSSCVHKESRHCKKANSACWLLLLLSTGI